MPTHLYKSRYKTVAFTSIQSAKLGHRPQWET